MYESLMNSIVHCRMVDSAVNIAVNNATSPWYELCLTYTVMCSACFQSCLGRYIYPAVFESSRENATCTRLDHALERALALYQFEVSWIKSRPVSALLWLSTRACFSEQVEIKRNSTIRR